MFLIRATLSVSLSKLLLLGSTTVCVSQSKCPLSGLFTEIMSQSKYPLLGLPTVFKVDIPFNLPVKRGIRLPDPVSKSWIIACYQASNFS